LGEVEQENGEREENEEEGEKSSTKLVEARKNSMLNPKANEDGGEVRIKTETH
jgi:hypothetical protein